MPNASILDWRTTLGCIIVLRTIERCSSVMSLKPLARAITQAARSSSEFANKVIIDLSVDVMMFNVIGTVLAALVSVLVKNNLANHSS